MHIEPFFDKETATFTYVVSDGKTCAVIDPVLGYNGGAHSTAPADVVVDYVQAKGLTVQWLLETHIHADHLTGSHYLQGRLGGKTAIGANIREVLEYWVPHYKLEGVPLDGSQFNKLFADGEEFSIGTLKARVMFTPGHTPACVAYIIEDAAFTGDTIFMPDLGTARTDFPGGSAKTLYRSIRKLLALPDGTRLLMGHDYPPEGRALSSQSTVAEQKKSNVLINGSVTEADYVKTRNARDHGKAPPQLLDPSLQFNLRAGKI